MEGDSYIFRSDCYEREVFLKFKEMRTKGLLTDLIVCVDQEELLCHKLVLAASSTYFSKMFSLDLRENLESRVTFNQVSPWVVKRIIEYAYTGIIEITTQNVQDVLAACCLFEYPAIVHACCNFLKLKLEASNCLGIEQFAHMHLCFQLEKDAHNFALENFSAVIEKSEFVQISVDTLVAYISDDNIDVVNESTVFSACLKWIHYDYECRKSVFCKIMQNVRFSTLDKRFLDSVVKRESHISQCEECSSLVSESSNMLVLKEHDTDSESKSCRRRPSTVAKETIFIIGGFDEERCVQRSVCGLNCQKKVYFSSPDMPALVCYFSTCVLNNAIYVTGGIASGNIVASVWRFTVETKQWQSLNNMRAVRARHASIAWKGKVYVIGGITADETNHNNVIPAMNIECFDPLFQVWTLFGYTPNPRKHSCLVAIDDMLLEVGGMQGKLHTESIFILDFLLLSV